MAILIKIGGSLIPSSVLRIYNTVRKALDQSSEKIFFFPGGGAFADLIRKYRKSISLSDQAMHAMALASLDQNAFLMADICQCACLTSFSEIEKAKKFPAVIAPYRLLTNPSPFLGYNLDIDIFSSDSSALYLAALLKAKFIIATDVDGVYEKDPKRNKGRTKLFRQMDARKLGRIKRGGPLDATLPSMMKKFKINLWVVNGKHPERILQIIQNDSSVKGTFIRFNAI